MRQSEIGTLGTQLKEKGKVFQTEIRYQQPQREEEKISSYPRREDKRDDTSLYGSSRGRIGRRRGDLKSLEKTSCSFADE